MSKDFVLKNVRPNGEAAKDILIRDGRFAEFSEHGVRAFEGVPVVDGEGLLMLPGLVDAHTHLDKTLLGMPWYRNDVGLELIDLIENERRMKRRGPYDTPAAVVGGRWYFAHDRAEQVADWVDELGWAA